jgi:quercetin 2,3-dioxygenase
MGNPNLPVRTVTSLHTAFRTLEGHGFEVLRAVPANDFEAVGPFIFLDHFGPIDVKTGEAKSASAHPTPASKHCCWMAVRSTRTAWATRAACVQAKCSGCAGRGVIHDESPDDDMRCKGGRFHGVQLWINMPKANKHDDPTYRHVRASEIHVLEAGDGKARTRLVAGRLGQRIGPIVTTGAPFVAHTTLSPGGAVELAPKA